MRVTSSTVGVDTTDFLADPLGPATVADALVHQPGEGRLLWAAYAKVHVFDIPGLAPAPEDGPPPDLVVWGPARDCLANRYMRHLPLVSPVSRLWTLTPQRLALHTEVPRPDPGPTQGLLARVAKFGRDLAEIVAEHRLAFGANVEDEPV
ncbi:MAG: hypothetical protein ACRDXB_09940, partial [Actinomycetes bacterium]